MTRWHGEQWYFQNNAKIMEHSDHLIMTGWHGEQWYFQNNAKIMEHFNHWITTGWDYFLFQRLFMRLYLRSTSVNYFRRCLILVSESFVNLIMKRLDGHCIWFNFFLQ
jgi:hypothetical protein